MAYDKEEKNRKISEAMLNNKNAEYWTIEEATNLFNIALELSFDREYDFIGEIAQELKTYKDIFGYLSNKFPELKHIHNQIISNNETNCFYNTKKGKIKEATGIVNLKSNHGWKDRNQTDVTSGDKPLQQPITIIYKGEELDIKK